MGTTAAMRFAFRDNKRAQSFCDFLYHNDYTNKTLLQNTVSVEVNSHGDRTVILEEAQRRGAVTLEDEVDDDY